MRYIIWLIAFMIGLSAAVPEFLPNQPTYQWVNSAQAEAVEAEDDTCISNFRGRAGEEVRKEGEEEEEEEGDGFVTQVISYIQEVIDKTSKQLFLGIATDSGFAYAVNAALILFVVFFGVAFMFGIVPLTYGQALTRAVKLAIVAFLLSPASWSFFNNYVVHFFNDGTDYLIDRVIGIATGQPLPDGDVVVTTGDPIEISAGGSIVSVDYDPKPFRKLERVVGDALSPEMMVSTLTMFTTGPMGPAMGGLLGIGLMAFIQMIVKAMRVYVISIIAKALLFGLAPIFITFVLFERTKQMFTGWVNQLVNYSLQPLFLFAFLSFFVVLIESSIVNILGTDICWTNVQHVSGQVTQNKFWRFVDKDGNTTGDDFTWEGLVGCIKGGAADCPDFPVSILDILTFLVLSHLAYRFTDVVIHIATEIASSTLFLDKLRSGMAEVIENATHRGRP